MSAPLRLPPRQRDILDGLANGHQLNHIAEKLHVSVSTLKVHARRLYEALGVATAAGAVDAGYRLGYLQLDRVPEPAPCRLSDVELLTELGRRALGPGHVIYVLESEES